MTRISTTSNLPLLVGLLLQLPNPSTGAANPRNVVINEVAYRGSTDADGATSCGGTDWVELFNTNPDNAVDLTGFVLHDDNGLGDTGSHTFSDVSIGPQEFLVLCRGESFGFSVGNADALTLLDDAGETLSTVALEGRATPNVTYALFDRFKYTATPTPGASNKFSRPVELDESDLFVDSIYCGAGLANCADAADCFSHGGSVCRANGRMDTASAPQCGTAQNLCSRCFPYSRCGGGEIRDDNSGVFESGGSCETGLARCEGASHCFDHAQGICQKDGSMLNDECEPVRSLCRRCYPNSRCGGLYKGTASSTADDASETEEASSAAHAAPRVLALATAAAATVLWMAAL